MNSPDSVHQAGAMALYAPQNNNSSSPMAAPVIPPYAPPTKQSGFPMFHDGDVVIVSPTGKQWKLHSLILAQASPVLNKILATAEPANLTKKDREAGKTVFFKLEMVDDPKFKAVDPQGLRYKAFRSMVCFMLRAFIPQTYFLDPQKSCAQYENSPSRGCSNH
jgi:hypothetical protein